MIPVLRYDFGTPLFDEAICLRDEILRRPLGRSIVDDDIEAEVSQIHLGYWWEGRLLGTASLVDTGQEGYKMRQVAVHPTAQKLGVGRALVRAGEAVAKTAGRTHIYCHARATAIEFYRRCGWAAYGEPFEEVGLPHQRMRRELA